MSTMKGLWYFLIITLLVHSCKIVNVEEESTLAGVILDIRMYIAIADEAFNDRLNPDSPAYFGDEYTNGIKILYYYKGNKLTFEEYHKAMLKWHYETEGTLWYYIDEVLAKYKTIYPPFWGLEAEGSDKYFYIDCINGSHEVYETGFSYTYICYPDGSEDEIKARIYSNKGLTVIDKIWINGELVKESHESLSYQPYYNPKYYPWMRQLTSSNGVPTGYLIPDGRAIVITK